jgi:FkbM family methyltransferase
MENKFAIHFFNNLLRDAYSVQTHNYDWLRYGSSFNARLRDKVKDFIAIACQKIHFVPWHYDAARLAFILDHLTAFNDCYCLLNDAHSRETMVKVLEFRILGPRHVKHSCNTDEFWRKYTTIDSKYARAMRTQSYWKPGCFLNRYEFPTEGQTVILDAHALSILGIFLLEQYAYNRGGETLMVKKGDIVIDGGGCLGDTALYFAAKAGIDGTIVSFEFMDENLNVLKKNLTQNPELAKRVRLVTKALWSRSGDALSFDNDGPGTRISSTIKGKNTNKVETASIDDVVRTEKLPKVDFIKMDIEGAELEGLKGAAETIKKYRPNLAISLYHKKEDFITIPQWIQSLDLGYEFYLDHFTIHDEETVLFATSRH